MRAAPIVVDLLVRPAVERATRELGCEFRSIELVVEWRPEKKVSTT